jgi:hypothetical protein
MNNFDCEADYIIGLYADFEGCSSVKLKQKNDAGKINYQIIDQKYHKTVSVKTITEMIDFKVNNQTFYYTDVFINNLPSLEKMISDKYTPKMVEINPCDKIFITKCLFNDKIISISEELKESIITNLNSYNPIEEKVNHKVMALFLALEAYKESSYLY